MPAAPTELLRDWHDFYMLVGTASATLVGLMFVATSISSAIFNEEHRGALATFITPTVVHFSAVLFAGLLIVMPIHTWLSLGLVLGLGGLAGTIYSAALVMRLMVRRRFKVDVTDRLFYVLIPLIGYLLIVAAAALIFVDPHEGADLLAVAIFVLLAAAIRNAWDMLVWIVLRTPTSGDVPPPST
jgi:hypothetical protein